MSGVDREYDVVVIGGGVAGWIAARRSQQLGASVVLLDRGPSGPGWSNSILSGGRIHAAYLNPRTADPDELYRLIMKKTGGATRPDVARAWADNTGRAIEYFASEGAKIVAMGEPQYLQTTLDGVPRSEDVYTPWRNGGPEQALTRVWHAFADDGGKMLSMTRAVDLVFENGVIAGVKVEKPDGRTGVIRAPKVIMADGGFQANRELVRKYITKHSYRPLGSEFDVGDCLLMGLRHGAQAVNMEAIYATIYVRDSLDNEVLRRMAPPTEVVGAGVVVNARGERVGDEAMGTEEYSVIDVRIATPISKTDAPDCWVVFDQRVWETTATSDEMGKRNKNTVGMTMNPALIEHGGTVISAPTVEELAEKIGMPPAKLRETIDGFNAFATEGAPIEPPRTNSPDPLTKAPYYAVPLLVGIYFAMGGLLVNGHAQVLGEGDKPIPNLYAAGGTMGGLQGGPANGYSGGWSEAATFGLLAAEHAFGPDAG